MGCLLAISLFVFECTHQTPNCGTGFDVRLGPIVSRRRLTVNWAAGQLLCLAKKQKTKPNFAQQAFETKLSLVFGRHWPPGLGSFR